VQRNLLSKDVATKLVHFPDTLEQITTRAGVSSSRNSS